MARAKSISVFLMDGESDGRYKCSIFGYTAEAYKVPKSMIDKCTDIEHLNQSGVYFLLGTDDNDNPAVYIGQACTRKNKKGLLLRVKEKHKGFPEWTETIMLTTSDDLLGPTEISYLENRFCNMAIEANRYVVKNGNEPNPGNISEEKKADMETFAENAELLIGTLGHNIFKPLVSQNDEANGLKLFFSTGKADAKAILTSEGIVLLKGSRISDTTVTSCPANVLRAREQHKDKVDSNYILKENILFDKTSVALSFATGNSISGPKNWKNEEGIPLEQLD